MADILYSIGLCHQSVSDRPKRNPINNPMAIFIVVGLQLAQRVGSILISDDNHITLMIMGEFGRYEDNFENKILTKGSNVVKKVFSLNYMKKNLFPKPVHSTI